MRKSVQSVMLIELLHSYCHASVLSVTVFMDLKLEHFTRLNKCFNVICNLTVHKFKYWYNFASDAVLASWDFL